MTKDSESSSQKRVNPEELYIDYSSVKEFKQIETEKDLKLLKRGMFSAYKARRDRTQIPYVEMIPRPAFGSDLNYYARYSTLHYPKGKMLVIVNYDLYPFVKDAIEQYVKDLAHDGHFAIVYRYKGGNAAQLRSFIIRHRYHFTKGAIGKGSRRLQAIFKRNPIDGVVFVGKLPVAWYEIEEKNSQGEVIDSDLFPCDLFFMDTNGVWEDLDGDGDYNRHMRNVDPEIWVGRIWSPDMDGNNPNLINDYFKRNHLFRKGRLGQSNLGVTIVDDDWESFGDCGMQLMFPKENITVHTDRQDTNANTYKYEMSKPRGWAQICAHSSPLCHAFSVMENKEHVTQIIPVEYIKDENPPQAFFYNLFACSNLKFTQPDYMGGWYIFDKYQDPEYPNPGMVAIGSTKSGSMLYFERFYGQIKKGKSVGEALVNWWKHIQHTEYYISWFYGLILLGDPTLNWWSGFVPRLRAPRPFQKFSHYKRLTQLEWEPVTVKNQPVEYYVEADAFGAIKKGCWGESEGKKLYSFGPLKETSVEFLFVGAQRGRWRVRAKVGDILCPWSDWRYFAYTI